MAGKKASLTLRLELHAISHQLMTNMFFSGICDAEDVLFLCGVVPRDYTIR